MVYTALPSSLRFSSGVRRLSDSEMRPELNQPVDPLVEFGH